MSLCFRAVGDAGPYKNMRNFWCVLLIFWRGTQAPPYRILSKGRCRAGPMCPAASDRRTSSNLCRGRRPRRPAIGANAPTFCKISGSGAAVETIQNLGTVLPKTPLAAGKEVTKPLVSCASLVTFCAHRKSPAGGRTSRFPHQSPARTNKRPLADESPAARAYYARTASADTAILRRKLACMLS